jgi:SAM-dependent methyltransferase
MAGTRIACCSGISTTRSDGNERVTTSVAVPQRVRDSAVSTVGAYFEKLCGIDRVTLGEDHVNPDRYLRNIEALDEIVPLRGKKVLEIGSGYGVSLAIMLQSFHADAVGIEPASQGFDESFRCSRAILEENHLDPARVIDSTGESLPFAESSFDVVYSNNVLEHTTDPAQVLAEALRVLKPGGTLYVEVPNYLAWYEGHYMVPQPPIVWRGLLPIWISTVCRRDPAFAHTLRTEINPIWLRRTLRRLGRRYPVRVDTLGEDAFLARMAKPFVFQTVALRKKSGLKIRIIQALNVGNWIGRLIVRLQAHYPIRLVATRLPP